MSSVSSDSSDDRASLFEEVEVKIEFDENESNQSNRSNEDRVDENDRSIKETSAKIEFDDPNDRKSIETEADECSKFACDRCPFVTAKKNNLRRHAATHDKDPSRPHQCPVCGKRFDSRRNLNDHRAVHDGKTRCGVCGRRFPDRGSLVAHRATHPALGCDRCPYTTTSAHCLKIHEYRHLPTKTFVCDACKKTFKSPDGLRRHKRYHEELACKKCGKPFADRARLKEHEATPHDRHKCDRCPYTTAGRSHLIEHMFTHAEEKTFGCDVCGKFFKSPQNMKQHKRRYH